MDAEVIELRRQVRLLEARLARLETGGASQDPAARQDGEAVAADSKTDRRHLLTKAATLAAGAVVGGTALVLTESSPASAAAGVFDGAPAVEATANPTNGIAIRGTSGSGFGVIGNSSSGPGVYGQSGSGTNGQGVLGVGTEGGRALEALVYDPEGTHLAFSAFAEVPSPPTSTSYRFAGAVVRDKDGDLWYSVAAGVPGQWRRIAGPSTAGAFAPLPAPVRVYDSRPGYLPAVGTKSPLPADTPRAVDLKANSSGVPAGATAALVNVVATQTVTGARGWLAIYKNGIGFPGTSSVNWSGPGQTVAVTTITSLDAAALCTLYAGSTCDVVIDVIGYYR